ncbi:MAG: Hsp20 family protein [Patescibacteria group bacterium]|nr:Hsp20 family protein [Patescibacteria group bacterium]
MAKQKKSFFEKLTGIKKIETEEEEVQVEHETPQQENTFMSQYQQQEESYEFPEQNQVNQGEFAQQKQETTEYEEPAPQPQPATEEQQEQSIESEGQLTIDVYQTDDDIVIKSTIAGVKPEDLDVNINNDMVTIRGERKQDEDIDPENYYYQECYWGPFSRSVILPVEIIADKAEATMKNGILTLRLPKADTTKSRKIQVRGY